MSNTLNEQLNPMDKARQTILDLYNRFLAVSKANTCFGEPIKVDDKTFIPVADVVCTTGFGVGYRESDEPGGQDGSDEHDQGGGGGAGGFIRSRSVAVVVVSRDGVTVEPVVDATQIALAGIAAAAFVGYWILRLMKHAGDTSEKSKGPSLGSFFSPFK